jgi:hypothetical protein
MLFTVGKEKKGEKKIGERKKKFSFGSEKELRASESPTT